MLPKRGTAFLDGEKRLIEEFSLEATGFLVILVISSIVCEYGAAFVDVIRALEEEVLLLGTGFLVILIISSMLLKRGAALVDGEKGLNKEVLLGTGFLVVLVMSTILRIRGASYIGWLGRPWLEPSIISTLLLALLARYPNSPCVFMYPGV